MKSIRLVMKTNIWILTMLRGTNLIYENIFLLSDSKLLVLSSSRVNVFAEFKDLLSN